MTSKLNDSWVALLSGLIFGLGLSISQMTDPNKIISFLNVLGPWDPSLLIVLVSALIVSTIGFQLSPSNKPLLKEQFDLPSQLAVDRQLVLGAAVFGMGWGLGGFCPGPAIAALGSGSITVIAFVAAFFVGGWLADLVLKAVSRTAN